MNEAVIDGGAPAPADTSGAALHADVATHNNPIQATMPEAPAQTEEKKAPSASEAIKAAQEKLAAKEAGEKVKPEQKSEAEKARAENGKFVAKPQETPKTEAEAKVKGAPEQTADTSQSEGRVSRYEAPARFNEQGKAEWVKAPESVQAEVHRTIKNLEDGYAKHKESAERYDKFRQYDDIAKGNGRDLTASLAKVIEFEKAMQANPLAAINFALREAGPRGPDGNPITIDDIVAHVAGQSNDERLVAAHNRIRELEAEVHSSQEAARIPSMVDEFRKSHPRFDELSNAMVPLIKAGHSMETAYELVDALKPAQSVASSATVEQPTQASPAADASSAPARPNPAGQKSISGAPSSGATSSGGKKRILSTSEALKAAMAKAS